jgi:hypothetical protein
MGESDAGVTELIKLQFIGRILPTELKLTVPVFEAQWRWDQKELDLTFRVKVDNSLVNVECELERYEPDYLVELHRRALDLAFAAANVVSFATGYGTRVWLDSLILPDGTSSSLVMHDPSLVPLCTAYGLQRDLNKVIQMVASDPALFRCLNDLVEAITLPHVSLVNCGRVIDSIRRMIAPDSEDQPAWQAMHKALNLSRSYQELVSQRSTGPRHGESAFVPGEVTAEITHRTWVIMNRFLEYRKQGNQQLTAPDFPLLEQQSP